MKAGILTLHQADNYGAVLQAYALQQTLISFGLENDLINIGFPVSETPDPDSLKGAAAVLMKRIRQENAKRHALFDDFRSSRLRCAGPFTNRELSDEEKNYDLFITGSDQVWNLRVLGADEAFFLPFAPPRKRASYAASFGTDEIPADTEGWCAAQLKDFARVSVREKSGRDLIRRLTGRDAVISTDPVFLPERRDWEALASEKSSEPYYCLYMVVNDEELERKASKAAAASGIGLKTITAAFSPRYGFGPYSSVGVTDWLGLISGSKGVFTNSFHGTAFALIFERPLMVSPLSGKLNGCNGRIEELLDITCMKDSYDSAELRESKGALSKEQFISCRRSSLDYLMELAAYAKSMRSSRE